MKTKYGKQVLISCCAYIGNIVFGFSAGWSTPVVPKIEENPHLIEGITTEQLNFIVALLFLGCIIGTIPLGPVANKIGRRPTLIIGSVFVFVTYICLAVVKSINWIIFVRICMGISCTIIMVMNLVYLGEIASTEIRGMLLGSIGMFNSVGFVIVFSTGPFVSYEVLNYIGAGIGLVYLAGMLYIPESPIFLIRKGRDEEAKAVLISLNRIEDADKLMEKKLEAEAMANADWKLLFTVKCNRRALFITVCLHILQQFSGIGPFLSYSTTIFQKAGSNIPPHIASIVIAIVQVLSGIVIPLFVERCGRKFLLMISTLSACISLAVLSVYLNLDYYGNPVTEKLKWLPLVMSIIYYVAYSAGFGIIPGALVGEMFQLNMRSPGTSVVLLVSWTSGFALLYSFGFIMTKTGIYVVFIFFSIICGITFLFTFFFVPETKGKSLMEVQKMLSQ